MERAQACLDDEDEQATSGERDRWFATLAARLALVEATLAAEDAAASAGAPAAPAGDGDAPATGAGDAAAPADCDAPDPVD